MTSKDDPPHDPEAERAVIGAGLNGADLPELQPSKFYQEEHRIIFAAMVGLRDQGKPTDLVTVKDHLESTGQLERAGGVSALSPLCEESPDMAHVDHYAAIVRRLAVKRTAAQLGAQLQRGDDLAVVLPKLEALREEARPAGLTMRGVGDLLTLELPTPEPVILPAIFTDEIVQIVAFRGTGKTYLGLTLAAGIAAGVDPVPGWSVPRARPTIYVDGELPHGRLKERVKAVCGGLGIDGPIPMYTISKTDIENRGRFGSLSTPEGRAALTECVERVFQEHGVMPVLFLDSLSTLLDASDENSREPFAPVGEWLIDLRGRGAVPVFLHHTGWNQDHGRGTSAREDLIDTSIRLRAPGDKPSTEGARFEVLFDKARNFEPGAAEPFELCLEAGPHGGVVFSRLKVGERRITNMWAAIQEVVRNTPRCSLNYVVNNVEGRKEDISKEVHNRIGTGELLNTGTGSAYKLSLPDAPAPRGSSPPSGSRHLFAGDPLGSTLSTDYGSTEKPSGTSADPPGNQSGTGTGTGSGSVVPTPLRGDGNHHGKPSISADLPLDPFGWTGAPKERLEELRRSGMTTMAAMEQVVREFEAAS